MKELFDKHGRFWQKKGVNFILKGKTPINKIIKKTDPSNMCEPTIIQSKRK